MGDVLQLFKSDDITYQVFEAVEDGKLLPVGKAVTLELLHDDDDGIFPSAKSWRAFIFDNFSQHCEKGPHWLSGECKSSTIKKWCYPLDKYKDKFVQQIGSDKFVKVDPSDLEFEFTFDCNRYRKGSDFCCEAEIYVTATIKE